MKGKEPKSTHPFDATVDGDLDQIRRRRCFESAWLGVVYYYPMYNYKAGRICGFCLPTLHVASVAFALIPPLIWL
jgi:hypothetical protein